MLPFGQLAFIAAGQAMSLVGLAGKDYTIQLTKGGFFDVQVRAGLSAAIPRLMLLCYRHIEVAEATLSRTLSLALHG
jgi:hypothetical protein